MNHAPLPTPAQREALYADLRLRLTALLDGEDDRIAAMATIACELHHGLPYFHWTGFYRVTAPELLVIGPYQGGHGCLRIPFSRGVCGAAARLGVTQRVPDVSAFEGHIACSATTRSEIVVPVLNPGGQVIAVLDVDSDVPDAFTAVDQRHLEAIAADLGRLPAR